MQIWQDEDEFAQEEHGGCCGLSAVEDARRVAARLDIPYYVMNFKEPFKKYVMDYFVEEYLRGRTPNPCNACNRYVKWEALLQRSLDIGADYIATGHYAKVAQLPNGRYAIANSVTAAKDQTYALYELTQEQLAHTLMPVGAYHKDEIRQIAENIGLPVAHKKDSQDICFIPDNDYASFIAAEVPERISGPGDFVLTDGTVVGRHEGITHYTIGQRRGLKVAVGKRIFVKAIDVEKNQVVLGDDSEVFTDHLYANQINCMAVEKFADGERYLAKIRYSHPGTMCRVTVTGQDELRLDFEEPVRAVTPGQAVVLYIGEYVAGGGLIR
jgi:tRNA-specific 2-thiouridylase